MRLHLLRSPQIKIKHARKWLSMLSARALGFKIFKIKIVWVLGDILFSFLWVILMEDLSPMERTLSFDLESYDIFDKINSILGDLQNLIKNVLKLFEKIEELLQSFKSVSLPQAAMNFNNTHNHQTPNSPGITRDTIEQPTVSGLHEIAGLKSIKAALYTLMVLPRQQPQLFQNRSASNSILLYGPPGTGKTRLVHGLAAESGAALYAISVSDLISSYVGETEKIKTELMCQMTKTEQNANMVIIAATNCPWDLDAAILRRFQKRLHVPLPNSEERLELFQLFTKNVQMVNTPEDTQKLIQLSEGFSGSDISSLVQDALDIPLTELQDTNIWIKTADGFYVPFTNDNPSVTIENVCVMELKHLPAFSVRARSVTVLDFLEAAKRVQVTVKFKDLKRYEMFKRR